MSPNPFGAVLDRRDRTAKPRTHGLTALIDSGEVGPQGIRDLMKVSGEYVDYAKIAWASALITGALDEKIECYRSSGITPMFGGTLFEYAFLRRKVDELLAIVRDLGVAVEVSNTVVDLSRAEKLRWIEAFARHVEVFSECGGKFVRQQLDWKRAIAEELSAGAKKVVIEGREIAPPEGEARTEFVEMILSAADPQTVVFEALERKQQWTLIQMMGCNVNLANIPVHEALSVEAYRLGLKHRTLMEMWKSKP